MNFTPQQLTGGGKYSHKTKIGNWYEDMESKEERMKKYIKDKEENKLAVNLTQQKYAKSFKKVPHTYSEDGQLRFGDKVMLVNKKTAGFLVIDMGDKIITHDEAYAVTTSKKAKVPSARNIFVIERGEKDDDYDDNIVHYGQKIKIKAKHN